MRSWLVELSETVVGSFLVRLYKRYDMSRLPLLTAALAYYAAFSLGPLLLLLSGWLGVFLRNNERLADQYRVALTELVAQLLPLAPNSEALVSQSFNVIVNEMNEGTILRSIISIVILLWASSNFFTSLQLALEVIFDVPQMRGYWRKRAVAVLLVASVALVIGVEIVGGLLNSSINELTTLMTDWLTDNNIPAPSLNIRWWQSLWTEVIRFSVATIVFTLCFRYLPRKSSSWLGALIGAVFSTASILIMRFIFETSFNLVRFNLIYGVVTGLLVVLLWLYFALLMFLVGALLVAEISEQVRPRELEATPSSEAAGMPQQETP